LRELLNYRMIGGRGGGTLENNAINPKDFEK
jgi:hypothetical protein